MPRKNLGCGDGQIGPDPETSQNCRDGGPVARWKTTGVGLLGRPISASGDVAPGEKLSEIAVSDSRSFRLASLPMANAWQPPGCGGMIALWDPKPTSNWAVSTSHETMSTAQSFLPMEDSGNGKLGTTRPASERGRPGRADDVGGVVGAAGRVLGAAYARRSKDQLCVSS